MGEFYVDFREKSTSAEKSSPPFGGPLLSRLLTFGGMSKSFVSIDYLHELLTHLIATLWLGVGKSGQPPSLLVAPQNHNHNHN